MLQKISLLRMERQAAKAQIDSATERFSTTAAYPRQEPHQINKRQLILSTIEDLKRSLEDQSIELCGLNDDDD